MPLDTNPLDERTGSAPGDAPAIEPLDVRSISLAALAVIAVIFLLHWAKAVLIPIALAVFLSYLLAPSVGWLRRERP